MSSSSSSQTTYVQSEQKDLQIENKSTPTKMPTSKNTKSKKTHDVQDTPVADVTESQSTAESTEAAPKMKKLFSHKKEVSKAVDEAETETEVEDNTATKPEPKAAKKRVKKDATEAESAEAKPKTKRSKKTTDASSDEQDSKPKRSKRPKSEPLEEPQEPKDTGVVAVVSTVSSDDADDAAPADDSQKKRKRSKKVRDPSAPKRPLSSFMVFSGLHRQEVSQSNPELKVTQISSKLGEMWGLLTDQQKAAYKSPVVVSVVEPNESGEPAESSPKAKATKRQKKSKDDKSEIAAINEKAEKKAKKAKKAEKKARKAERAKNPDAPKKPLSSFMIYSNEHRQEVKTAHPELKITQIAKILGQMWHQLSAEEQSKYKIIVVEPSVTAPVVDAAIPPVETF